MESSVAVLYMGDGLLELTTWAFATGNSSLCRGFLTRGLEPEYSAHIDQHCEDAFAIGISASYFAYLCDYIGTSLERLRRD